MTVLEEKWLQVSPFDEVDNMKREVHSDGGKVVFIYKDLHM